jgi:hypothetical protein
LSAVLARHNAELDKLGPGHLDEDASTWAAWEAAGNREGKSYWTFWHTMPTTAAGMAAYFQYLAEPRWPAHERQPHDPIIDDAIGCPWHHEYGSADGDGGMPGLTEWMRTMELALRRIAATA